MANFKNFLEYTKKLQDPNLLKDLDNFMLNFLDKKGQEVIARTKLRTPVDTGALRASWQTKGAKKQDNKYFFEIENNQNYASFVEYGTVEREWKWKDGAFMLTKSLNDVRVNLHNDFNKDFTNFLKQKGIG